MRKIIFILALLFSANIHAADSTFTFVPKGKTFLIGDQFEIKATLFLPMKSTAVWPVFNDTITSKLEIISTSKKDTLIKNNVRTVSQKIVVTCFDTGYIAIPSIEIKDVQGKIIAKSQAQWIEIKALPLKGDEIKPIKEPLDTPFIWAEIKEELIYGSIALLLLIALGIFLWWYFKKRKKPEVKIVVPQISAKDAALQKLQELENKKLWQQGQNKNYQSELSTILREFLENKFAVIALELTTHEIMQQLSRTPISLNEREKLQRILQIADMTKFAKAEPTAIENELCLSLSKEFIQTCG